MKRLAAGIGSPALALVVALLSACQSLPVPVSPAPSPPAAPASAPPSGEQASLPAPPEPFRNIYTQEKDSAPVAPPPDIDYAAIPDAVPAPEPRGKYGNKSPYKVNGRTYTVLADARGYRAEGIASWYGKKFHGHRTSSFEKYDMYAMTAAHTTLPIPTYVRVTNLDNDRSVIVRVNDRGPFHPGRIIDLSWAAAQKLGYIGNGTARVRVEAIEADAPPADAAPAGAPAAINDIEPGFYVQLGAFSFPDAARQLAERARATVGERVTVLAGDDLLYRVRVGPYEDRASAERMRDTLTAAAVGTPALVIVPVPTAP